MRPKQKWVVCLDVMIIASKSKEKDETKTKMGSVPIWYYLSLLVNKGKVLELKRANFFDLQKYNVYWKEPDWDEFIKYNSNIKIHGE